MEMHGIFYRIPFIYNALQKHRQGCFLCFTIFKPPPRSINDGLKYHANKKGLFITGLYRIRYTSAGAVRKLLKVTLYFNVGGRCGCPGFLS